MGQASLKRNAFYNTIKSVSSIIIPLITYPYATSVLGRGNLGRVSMSASIVSYFVLIAVFGISSYAVRECSYIKDDRETVDTRVSELMTFSIVTTFIALVLLALCTFIVRPFRAYAWLILIQSLGLIFTTLGLDWINVIFEDYKYISIRSVVISLINMVILFAFVKTPDDYYIYAFLTVSTTVFVGILNFVYVRRYVTLRLRLRSGLKRYIRDLMPFFINEIGIVIYVSSDTTILGLMKNDDTVGIYSVAVKIYSIIKSVFIAIYSVTLPRLSDQSGRNDMEGFRKILSSAISVFILLAVPVVCGLALYAEDVILICGEEYRDGAHSLRLLAVALLFAVFGGIVTRCVNIPLGYEKVNSTVTAIAAAENIVLNIPAIYLWSERGAAATTAIAELTVLILCIVHLRREGRDMRGIINLKDALHAAVSIIPLIFIYIAVRQCFAWFVLRLLIGVSASVIVYGIVLIVLRNHLVLDILGRFLKKKRA